MAMEPSKVVVIQDASSRDVYATEIKRAFKEMSLQPGDEIMFLAILDRFSSPMGYKISVDSSSITATTNRIVEEELARKKEDYHNNPEIMKLSDFCTKRKILFQIDVVAGPSPEVAFNAARSLRATWLILDRQINKDKKNLDSLPCGIYRIRSDGSIKKVKDPPGKFNSKSRTVRQAHVMYTGMMPGNPEEEVSPKRPRSSSSEQLTETGTTSFVSNETSTSSMNQFTKNQEQERFSNIEQEGTGTLHISNHNEQQPRIITEASEMEEDFTSPLCSECNKKRPKVGCKKDFSYAELYTATQGFSQKNFLSEGGFGSVYKGEISGITIAVKQHKNASIQGEKEFKSEVNLLSKARHENVVMLLGSCSEGNRRLLVYEYVCNGSLDQHLSQHSRKPLSWEQRIKVAIGAARGLLYLHENNIIHRDMRPNNILITHDHNPLLGDFGLARNQHEDSIHSTEVVGTLGYLAPEYAEFGKVSAKTDVYSFGVVMLELITGMRTTDKRLGGRSLVGWARPLLRERNYPELIDGRIMNSHDFHQLFWMVRIAEKCLSRDPQKRLNMTSVVNALSRIVEGNTCGIMIRDSSPAKSDSLYSASDSDDQSVDNMQEEEETYEESDCELESMITNYNTPPTYCGLSMMNHMIIKHPPSPPIRSISSSMPSTFKNMSDESSSSVEETDEDHNERMSQSNSVLLR